MDNHDADGSDPNAGLSLSQQDSGESDTMTMHESASIHVADSIMLGDNYHQVQYQVQILRREKCNTMPGLPLPKYLYQLLMIILLVLASSTKVSAADDSKNYIYRAMAEDQSDPILEYYIDPGLSELDKNKSLAFLYNSNYPRHRVVEFYSPMCPHCIRFAPHYIEFARHFSKLTQRGGNHTNATIEALTTGNHYTGMEVEFHAVSCYEHRKLCSQQKIRSYPSLKLFKKGSSDGKPFRYTELHPMTLVKIFGVSVVDDYWEDEEKELVKEEEKAVASSKLLSSNLAGSTTKESSQPKDGFWVRSPQEVFSDAYLSFHTAMKTSLFVEEGGGAAIPKARQYALQNWLDLLQKVLPPWRIHELLGALLGGNAGVKNKGFAKNIGTEETWAAILDQYPPRQTEWSSACRQHALPYTCGLWTLFHIVSVGVVEFNSDIANKEHDRFNVFNNEVVSRIIKEYVQHFLLCDECSNHFVEEYEACKYDRCDRLSDKGAGKKDDWKELSVWLLETHNGVNLRLQEERFQEKHQLDVSAPASPTIAQQQSVMWPTLQECPNCWLERNGTISLKKYNHSMMYRYLRLIYWPFDEQSLATRQEIILMQADMEGPEQMLLMTREIQYLLVAVVIASVAVYTQRRRLFGAKTRTR